MLFVCSTVQALVSPAHQYLQPVDRTGPAGKPFCLLRCRWYVRLSHRPPAESLRLSRSVPLPACSGALCNKLFRSMVVCVTPKRIPCLLAAFPWLVCWWLRADALVLAPTLCTWHWRSHLVATSTRDFRACSSLGLQSSRSTNGAAGRVLSGLVGTSASAQRLRGRYLTWQLRCSELCCSDCLLLVVQLSKALRELPLLSFGLP
jgi:hypothetical protein